MQLITRESQIEAYSGGYRDVLNVVEERALHVRTYRLRVSSPFAKELRPHFWAALLMSTLVVRSRGCI